MTQGILYIVFGSEYNRLAAYTVSLSSQQTNLPICVITNIGASKRSSVWADARNVTFIELAMSQRANRSVKTLMHKYTPFDETLYLDCDSVIRLPGIECVFRRLRGREIILNRYLYWDIGTKIPRIYRDAMSKAFVALPLSVYNGAFICWSNCYGTRNLFEMWNELWKRNGSGREMPALACAAKLTEPDILTVTTDTDKYFAPDTRREDCIVQHNYNTHGAYDWHGEFGLPKIREFKPFDGDPNDWRMVDA